MTAPNDPIVSTLVYCHSHEDGTIVPARDETDDREFRGQFEVGLTVADRYVLQKSLGNGSMGRVFLAKDLRLDRPVAIKVVAHHRRGIASFESAFAREAKLGANLSHRGIAAVFDFGLHENKSYTVFEYLEGETLRMLMQRRGRIPLDETQQIITDLAAALDFAHARGVIHRDLKPENICFTRGGEFKILDLGIARDLKHEVESRRYSGTPAYSSPEQAECRLTDGRSDQYALGLITFEMLMGRRLFVDPDPHRLLRMHIEQEPPRLRQSLPELPEEAEHALLRSLEKDPDDRFATLPGVRSGTVGRHRAPVVSSCPEDAGRESYRLLHRACRRGITAGPAHC